MKKTLVTLALTAAMVGALLPMSSPAFATETGDQTVSEADVGAESVGNEYGEMKTVLPETDISVEDNENFALSSGSAGMQMGNPEMDGDGSAGTLKDGEEIPEGDNGGGSSGEEVSGETSGSEITENDRIRDAGDIKDILSLALPANKKETVRWTYSSSSSSYTEFYVTAYDKDGENELSFDVDYSITDSAEEVTIDLTDLADSVSNISDGTYAYTYSYATIYGIDNDDNSHKSEESYWQTLGAEGQPVTKLVITHTQMSGYAIWGYNAYSEDTLLGTIKVRAHDDNTYPYIYLQLWCDRGEAFPIVAENVNTGVGYTQLDAALGEATDGDTIQLLVDLDVEMTKTDQFTIDTDLTVDLNGKTITVSSDHNSYRLFYIASGVEAAIKNGTMDGGASNASGNAIYGNGSSSKLTDVSLEGLTIKNFGDASNYGTVHVYDGSLTVTNCTFSDNKNSAITVRGSSGDTNLYDGSTLTLKDCTISGNSNATNNYGGGVGVRQIQKVNIFDSVITGNEFLSTPGGIYGGGGIILYNVGEIMLDNNTITQNESSMYGGGVLILSGSAFTLGDKTTVTNNTIEENKAALNGGGLTYYINAETHGDEAYCTFSGNTIDANYSDTRGGGMSMYSNDPDFTFTILSGDISNNKAAGSGGGIDFAWERPATLQLYSTLIAENIAVKGGGVWLCPTSETRMHVTFGGAIYDNEALDSADVTESCGDEIRFEGDSYGDSYTGMIVNIASRALGGTLMDWYTDEYGARYRDGSGTLIDVKSPEYSERTEEFSVHGELSESGIVLAKADAATIISGNEAEQGYGGGIASNAVIEFGEVDTELTVKKTWTDEKGNEITQDLPSESIEATLVRVSGDGTKADLETVILGEENGWTWTFKELPSNYSYEVREETEMPGYGTTYDTTIGEDGMIYITITNTLEMIDVSGAKIWDDADDQEKKRPSSITIHLQADGGTVDSITVTEDDGWKWDFTGLPKYKDGEEIIYTITEEEVPGYSTSYDGYNVINSYNPDKDTEPGSETPPSTGNPNSDQPNLDQPNSDNPSSVKQNLGSPNQAGGSKTGDSNMVYFWIILMIAAAALIIVVSIVRARKLRARR